MNDDLRTYRRDGGPEAADTAAAAGTRRTRTSRGAASAATQSGADATHPHRRLFSGDRVLWIIIVVLSVISVLVVYSSTAKMAYDAHTVRSTSHFLQQQVMILGLSFGIMLFVHKIDCRIYFYLTRPAYFLSLLLTVAVYFIGATTNGAARWIPLGPFQFQPSEALKVATVLFLAQ